MTQVMGALKHESRERPLLLTDKTLTCDELLSIRFSKFNVRIRFNYPDFMRFLVITFHRIVSGSGLWYPKIELVEFYPTIPISGSSGYIFSITGYFGHNFF